MQITEKIHLHDFEKFVKASEWLKQFFISQADPDPKKPAHLKNAENAQTQDQGKEPESHKDVQSDSFAKTSRISRNAIKHHIRARYKPAIADRIISKLDIYFSKGQSRENVSMEDYVEALFKTLIDTTENQPRDKHAPASSAI